MSFTPLRILVAGSSRGIGKSSDMHVCCQVQVLTLREELDR